MAIDNYTALQSAISDWMHRDDLPSVNPVFISLAEARMTNELDCPELYKSADLALSAGACALPSDFKRMVSLKYADYTLDFQPLERVQKVFGAQSGQPVVYTLHDGGLMVFPAVDGTASAYYKAALPALATALTSPVLSAYPDLYLHCCLIYAAQYVQDAGFVAGMEQLYQADLNRINVSSWGRGSKMAMQAV